MTMQIPLALALTVASACLINWGYLGEHAAASKLPPLSLRRPLASLRLLAGSRGWLVGFGAESVGFGLYVAAVALAPLALVQAVAAGGIGVLALLVARTGGGRLETRERVGVAVAIGGLVLLAVSLAGGSEGGRPGAWPGIALWLGASVAAAALAIGSGARALRGGAAFGVAAGILFGAGDVATKVLVGGGDHVVIAPAMVAFYAAGTIVLQLGFQRGRALTTAGIATLGTNAIPIAAAMTLFAEPLPAGAMGIVRVASFAAVVAGAVALAPGHRAGERREERAGAPPERGAPGRVVCGVDDSPGGREAVRVAARLAARLDAELLLVHAGTVPVAPGASGVPGGPAELAAFAHEVAERVLERVAVEAGAPSARRRAALGPPAAVLRRLAAEEQAALLVVGSRGRGRLRAGLLGSVAAALCRRAPCPVLVVPPPAARRGVQARDLVAAAGRA